MKSIRVFLAQMRVEDGEPVRNVERAWRRAWEAWRLESDILVLPELWGTGYSGIDRLAEEPGGGLLTRTMEAISSEYSLYVAGTLPLRTQGGVTNSLLLYDSSGNPVARYDKTHLFTPFGEDKLFKPGNRAVVVDTPLGRIGFMICYDMRFPELARSLGLMGAELVIAPSAWGRPRLNQWRNITRARAAENQYFLAAANRCGPSTVVGEEFAGHSVIIDPWGDAVVEAGFAEASIYADLDPQLMEKARSRLPLYKSRRPDIYRLDA